MNTTPTILALDASSTMLGYVVYDGSVFAFGEIALSGADIADRCRQAHISLDTLLKTMCAVDVIAIEAPVAFHAKAVIPQARVSGALLACAALRSYLVVEVTPNAAKKALAGQGNADKTAMQQAAAEYGVTREHAADVLGVALAALGVVTVERRAA
jgi:Holliday junction resolvasome RuvABC endonuclease subunit